MDLRENLNSENIEHIYFRYGEYNAAYHKKTSSDDSEFERKNYPGAAFGGTLKYIEDGNEVGFHAEDYTTFYFNKTLMRDVVIKRSGVKN